MPLPVGARSYAAAGAILENRATLGGLVGDGLVPLDSALGRHADPARALPFDDTWVGYGLGHRDLLTDPEVIAQVEAWLS